MSEPRNTAAQRETNAEVNRALVARDIAELKEDMVAVRAEIAELIALFKGAKAVVNMVKWVGGFGAGLAAIWAVIDAMLKSGLHPK